MTGRLAALIEQVIKQHPINVGGLKLEVAAQTLPSLNSRMEREIGADLYISIVRRDKHPPVSKGLLVQAKWDDSLDDPRLPGQIKNMTDRTEEAFVWAYGPAGINSMQSQTFTSHGASGLHGVPRPVIESSRWNDEDAEKASSQRGPRRPGR